jgi:hypothetical protein
MIARDGAAGTSFDRTSPPGFRWYHKMAAILMAIFCFEVGVFLVVFPWMEYWPTNYFASVSPAWRGVWESNYFRGALSGLGLVNVYIALVQVFRLRRFSEPD